MIYTQIMDFCLLIWYKLQGFVNPVFDFILTDISVPYFDFSNITGPLPSVEFVTVSILDLVFGAGILYFFGHMIATWILNLIT